jgi:sugar lactone lactonase YvrE
MTVRVMGGLTPISGATVNVYAAGTGYGSGAILLATGTTDTNGEFSVSFACSPLNQYIYMTSTGGNAGAGTNAAIGLMLVAGDCTASSFPASVVINELTTVAAIWPTAQFNSASGTTYAATLGGPATGLNAALTAASYLIDPSTGQPPNTPPAALAGAGAIPTTKINTLADILANCVQSKGASSTACKSLFTSANLPNKPTNTLEAALNIALNPTNGAAALYALAAGGPFSSLSAAPASWTLALTWTGGGLANPYGVAVDGSGNVWTTNAGLPATAPGTTVSELSPATAAWLSGASGYGSADLSGPEGIAIDAKGSVWISNTCPGCTTTPTNLLTQLSSKGVLTKNFSTNLSGPLGIAIDNAGNVWVANSVLTGSNNYVVSENAKGSATAFTTLTYTGLDQPAGIATDNSGNLWLTNTSGTAVSEYLQTASQFANYSSGSTPLGIAPDPYGDVWAVSGGSLSEYNASGFVITPSSVTTANFSGPKWLAIDSAGDLWVTNNTGNSITEVTRSGGSSPTFSVLTPFTNAAAAMSGPMGIAIDLSGNVWVANNGAATGALTEFLGVAAPVQTPVIGVPGKPTVVSGGGQN